MTDSKSFLIWDLEVQLFCEVKVKSRVESSKVAQIERYFYSKVDEFRADFFH